MEILGREYVIEHCISALNYDMEQENVKKGYRAYVTDALYALVDNSTHHLSINGVEDIGLTLNSKWLDILEPPTIAPPDNRPCNEIAQDIWARIRGKQ